MNSATDAEKVPTTEPEQSADSALLETGDGASNGEGENPLLLFPEEPRARLEEWMTRANLTEKSKGTHFTPEQLESIAQSSRLFREYGIPVSRFIDQYKTNGVSLRRAEKLHPDALDACELLVLQKITDALATFLPPKGSPLNRETRTKEQYAQITAYVRLHRKRGLEFRQIANEASVTLPAPGSIGQYLKKHQSSTTMELVPDFFAAAEKELAPPEDPLKKEGDQSQSGGADKEEKVAAPTDVADTTGNDADAKADLTPEAPLAIVHEQAGIPPDIQQLLQQADIRHADVLQVLPALLAELTQLRARVYGTVNSGTPHVFKTPPTEIMVGGSRILVQSDTPVVAFIVGLQPEQHFEQQPEMPLQPATQQE